MAIWSIQNTNGTDEKFVDSQTTQPGEEGFTTDEVIARANGRKFNYLGISPTQETPNAKALRKSRELEEQMQAYESNTNE